jgi:hypothetical protein
MAIVASQPVRSGVLTTEHLDVTAEAITLKMGSVARSRGESLKRGWEGAVAGE